MYLSVAGLSVIRSLGGVDMTMLRIAVLSIVTVTTGLFYHFTVCRLRQFSGLSL
ncbi:MAG: hypothetical protein ACI9Y1_003631 [Lentisphaeria bacterium]|jgi:hypothetical protein